MAWTLNEVYIENKPWQLAAQILEGLPDLKFRGVQSLQHLYYELLDLSIEMAKVEQDEKKGTARGVLTRYINSTKKKKRRTLPNDHTKMLGMIYDMVLAAEGLGCLPGFGFGNKFGDQIRGNPERQSIYTIEPLKTRKKKEDRTMTQTLKRSELVTAVKELNEVLGLDPAINAKAKPAELEEKLIEAMALLVDDDELTSETQNVLDILKDTTPAKSEESESEEAPEPAGEDAKEEEGTEEEDNGEDENLIAEVKAAKKLPELKELVETSDVFKSLRKKLTKYQGLQGPRQLKADMLDLLGEGTNVDMKGKKTAGKAKKTSVDYSKSNKAKVYLAWKKGETDIIELHKIVAGAVKESTIKSWTNQWKKGKALPAIAKR